MCISITIAITAALNDFRRFRSSQFGFTSFQLFNGIDNKAIYTLAFENQIAVEFTAKCFSGDHSSVSVPIFVDQASANFTR